MMKWIFILLFYLIFAAPMCLYSQDSVSYEQEIDTSNSSKDTLEVVPLITVDTFVKREFDSSFKSKYNGKAFDYTETIAKPKEKKDTSISLSGLLDVFVYLIYIIIGLGIVIGIYILVSVILGKEGNWLINKKSDDKTVFYGDDLQQVADSDFKYLIQQALEANDLRSAVRYHYLLLLQKLSNKNIISLHKDKTNSDYKHEIKDITLRQSFGYLSYIYDYAWYGEFEISRADYEQVARVFDETTQMI